ncbi:ATP-binding protein [Derxia lacustris]|uniref:ATP-binding protein n=1 Tax=Derxia lacustris TaxID=764842 RepID=UPI001C387DC7|nr:ATP-binding protein [Derxia lacustris]
MISTVLRFHDRQPRLAALAAVLGACSLAALLMFWGSVEVQQQARTTLDALGAQCASAPAGAAALALCDALAVEAGTLGGRGRTMLALQAGCLALLAGGFALILRRAPEALAGRARAAAPPTPVADAEPAALRCLREAGRLLRAGDVNEPVLLRALAMLETALGARGVALRLPADTRQLLGAGALLCTHGEPALALPLPGDARGEVGARLIPPGPDLPLRTLLVPVTSAGLPPASLSAEFAPDAVVGEAQVQLAECFATLCALAIAGVCRSHEERRVALMEERSAIAGELHDSLAQSLAYMKIQVAQLQRALDDDAVPAGVRQAALDLRGGLSTAYREVRELIAAFRVSMGPGGLREAVQDTIDEFGQRSGIAIAFEHELDRCPLEINEEFHVMQVVREALSNIVRHAGAEHAWVAVRYGPDHRCTVTVEDDGRGLPAAAPEGNHYGMSIMKERARSLDGEVGIEARDGGGTRVRLSFVPQRLPAEPMGAPR